MKIVFMGTPDYAVATLEALIKAGHSIAAVFCQPDKPVGRKHILTPPPVKVCAESHNIPVFQPDTLRDGKAFEDLKKINPDVIVVVAYGKLLPEEILRLPKFGCVNGHASLLPKYRGASPIQWCIVCGETETGVTAMLMDKGMDTGDILKVSKVKIGENETAEQLFERLNTVTAELLVETLADLEQGKIIPIKQNNEEASYAPIIKKEMALIDFRKSAREIFNSIRGYYSWPCAYFYLNGKRIKAIEAKMGEPCSEKNGVVIKNSGDALGIACGDNMTIEFTVLQAEGSKAMTAKQFFCGNNIEIGSLAGEQNG